ncbi:MAG: 4Fe-4S dicluster domain-containing protein, partial [Devosia sp.]
SPDGKTTFDRSSSVFLANIAHEEDQPVHLRLADPAVPLRDTLPAFGAEPAPRYCPAGVYEIVEVDGAPRFRINAQNCVHCKTCDIKDPAGNITWVPPEGGSGPNYVGM